MVGALFSGSRFSSGSAFSSGVGCSCSASEGTSAAGPVGPPAWTGAVAAAAISCVPQAGFSATTQVAGVPPPSKSTGLVGIRRTTQAEMFWSNALAP